MTQIARQFLSLLRLGLETTDPENEKALLSLSMEQWRELMLLAERQGVAAVAFDGVQRLYDVYGKEIYATCTTPAEWLQWVFDNTGIMTQYEQRCQEQKRIIGELSEIWAKEDIRMMVFKGQSNATFYPRPEHRATGDIDCWLFGEANRGDEVLKKTGAIVDNGWYRHSKISYNGETIENHRVMSHTRGSKKKKAMEEELRYMANDSRLMAIDGCGKALMPSAQFNACFLTYHGMHHFLTEGLRMKQVLDWVMFLKAKQDSVDWAVFYDFCKRYKLDRIAAVMNYIAMEYLGVSFNDNHNANFNVGQLAERVIKSTLFDDDYLFNSGKSDWEVRWSLVKNMLARDRWKYEDIAQENVCGHLWENVKGFILRNDD